MAVSGELSPDDMATAFQGLLPLSNKTLKDITDETPGLLVFPDCIENTEDRIKDMPVITVDIPLGKNISAEAAKIKTGNIAGFIGIPSDRPGGKEVHLKITSRFVNERPGDEDKDYFLYYLLEKVFSVNLFDLKDLSRKGQFDFLLFLFPYYLFPGKYRLQYPGADCRQLPDPADTSHNRSDKDSEFRNAHSFLRQGDKKCRGRYCIVNAIIQRR